MNSILYDTQEIFFLVYSPCWTVLLALFIAGAVVEAIRRIITAIWRQQRALVPSLPADDVKGE